MTEFGPVINETADRVKVKREMIDIGTKSGERKKGGRGERVRRKKR